MALFRSFAAVSSLTFISRVLGYGRDLLIASTFGDSGVSDIFFQAFRLPNLFRSLFAEGALNSAFIPLFTRVRHHHGAHHSTLLTRNVFSALALILLGVCVIFEIFMPQVMAVLAPGFKEDPEKFNLTVSFGRVLFPYLFFIALAAVCMGVLNSLGRFSAAGAAPIFLNLFCILGLSLASSHLSNAGFSLCAAATAAGVVQLLWLWGACYLQGVKITLVRPVLTPEMHQLLRKILPGLASAGVYQINLLVSTSIASFVPLAVSYLAFADRVNQFPLSVIGIAIGTVLLPLVSRQVLHQPPAEVLYLQNRAIQFGLAVTLPAASALCILSLPIVGILFKHGRFTDFMATEVSKVLGIYSLALPLNVLIKIFNMAFFARGNTRLPMVFASLSIALNLGLTLLLFSYFSYYGIAAAGIFSSLFHVTLLGRRLFLDEALKPDRRLGLALLSVVASCTFLGAALYTLAPQIFGLAGDDVLRQSVSLVALILGGAAFYGAVLFLLKGVTLEEIRETNRISTLAQIHA